VCICSLRYPACNAHAQYSHLWAARLYNIFPHFLINDMISEEKVLSTKYVLTFSTTFVWNILYSEEKWARYDKNIFWSSSIKYPLFFSDFNEAWIFSTDFRKILKYQILWKSVQWEPSCSCRRIDGRTDRHDPDNSRFSQFCECP